jgi:hypothetical protein
MAISTRERYISFACVFAGAILAVDRLAWTPYLEQRSHLLEQRQNKLKEVTEARLLLAREKHLRAIMAKLGPSMESDSSATEVRLFHLVHDWEQQSGVNNLSFHRVRAVDEAGFSHMTFHVSAGGGMSAVASLIYAVETAEIPLRIDDLHVTPKRDGAELLVQMNLSTLCRRNEPDPRRNSKSTETALLDAPGARP